MEGRRLPARGGRWRGIAGQARAHVCGEVLLGLLGGRYGLEVAEVVGLKGIVVAGAERSPRLDHLRNAAIKWGVVQ